MSAMQILIGSLIFITAVFGSYDYGVHVGKKESRRFISEQVEAPKPPAPCVCGDGGCNGNCTEEEIEANSKRLQEIEDCKNYIGITDLEECRKNMHKFIPGAPTTGDYSPTYND